MSFYNIYRPKVLEEIDNEQVRSLITSLLSKKKEDLPHAYFLTGPRGIGKTTTARIIAKLFNCQQPKKNGEPCGECNLCTKIAQGTALDVFEMDAASNTGVDNIRELKDKIILAPIEAQWKVYIIDEVHMLSTGAFNALLKTLEEPPPRTVFILATTDSQKVPQTIQSRCLLLQFKKPEEKEIIASLSRIAAAETLEISDSSLRMIANAADGSFRDAVKFLEQASLVSKRITDEIVRNILSLPEDTTVNRFIDFLEKKDAPNLINEIEALVHRGADIREFYHHILKNLQRTLVGLITETTRSSWSPEELRKALEILLRFFHAIRGNVFPDLALELAILEYTSKHDTIKQNVSDQNTQIHSQSVSSINKKKEEQSADKKQNNQSISEQQSSGNLALEQLTQHWNDVIAETKSYNHSISGILRSTRPKNVSHGIVTIEAFYEFHKDKLSEPKAREAIAATIKKLFGEHTTIEIVLGKKGA
ncbi:MAG: DNA polymerase III subunit gamma/tau [Patescibacteria group bacterium]|nr:DNA polymerase III subunit gamma/tau [Patescibacteria group bacterium]